MGWRIISKGIFLGLTVVERVIDWVDARRAKKRAEAAALSDGLSHQAVELQQTQIRRAAVPAPPAAPTPKPRG